ncbi:hypothetical protein [Neobacillus muris]|uniref:hypothetical protein n=1 Tax=Neobacillus muris TaxID=2941334 RepID=UPI002041F1BC|nr:hypothetical protein [Neobacillus muris]
MEFNGLVLTLSKNDCRNSGRLTDKFGNLSTSITDGDSIDMIEMTKKILKNTRNIGRQHLTSAEEKNDFYREA